MFQGKNVEYVQQDDNNRRWFNEFRSKASSNPIAFETVDCKYRCTEKYMTVLNYWVTLINIISFETDFLILKTIFQS